MEIKSLNKGNIYLYSKGLSKEEKMLTGVNIISNVENLANKTLESLFKLARERKSNPIEKAGPNLRALL